MEASRKSSQRQSLGGGNNNSSNFLSSSFVRKSIDRQQLVAMTQRHDDLVTAKAIQLSTELGCISVNKSSPQKVIASERIILARSNKCSVNATPSKDNNIIKCQPNEDVSVLKLESNNGDSENQDKKEAQFTAEELQVAIYNSQQAEIKPNELKKPNSRLKKTFRGGQQQYKFAVFPGNYPQYIRDCLSDRDGPGVQWVELEATVDSIQMCDFIWKPFNFAKFGFDLFDRRSNEIPKRPIVYNHFENIHILSTKTGLLQTLKEYYHNQCKEAIEAKYKVQDTIPMAYIITSIPGDHEFNEFKKKFKQIDRGYYLNEKMAPKHMQQNFWLLKPSNLNQGKGIEIFNSLKQVSQYLQCKSTDLQWVVQKYIEKPLLYHKRKFDIRVLALATNEMELFYYDIGYMRTSSDEYSLNNQNKFVHLTNNCYQKNSNNYERFEEGNQLSFQQFQNYLDETFPDLKVSFNEHMLPRIKDLVIDCFVSAIGGLNPNKREHCFELMGFDFLIDEDFRVWLIEVNTNPYFGVVNNQLPNFIANLVDDTFKLTLDKFIEPGYECPFRNENLYELLYSQSQGVNKRRPFTESLYPVTAIKEQLDRERENMVALRFPGAKGAISSDQGQQRNGNNGQQLPTLVRSAGPPLHNYIKSSTNIQQQAAVNSIQAQGMVVVGANSGTPLTTNGLNKASYQTLEDGLGENSTAIHKPFQQQRTIVSREDKNSLIIQQPKECMIPQTVQSTRSKVSLSNGKDTSYGHQTDEQLSYLKKKTQFTKYKNNFQSEERAKAIPHINNSVHKRRNRIGRIEPLNNNNSTSLGRIYNRDQTSGLMPQSQNNMAQRRGTTPAIKLKNENSIPEVDGVTPKIDIGEAQNQEELTQPTNNQSSPRASSTFNKAQISQQQSGNTLTGNNLSIFLRKRADEKIQATQQSQTEYLNKIQKMLKVKTLLEQVKESLIQIDSYEQKRKDFGKIFAQICHVFSNHEGTSKKEVSQAIQAFRMMIFSQFIIHFNDKSVLSKLLDILKQPQSHLPIQSYIISLEIRESILKNMTEISKHYSIRSSLLSRKLLSKLMKSMYEHVHHHMTVTLKNHASLASSLQNKSSRSLVDEDAIDNEEGKEMAHYDSRQNLEKVGNEVAKSQMEVRVVQSYVSLVISLGSVNNTKFYIPGETKEVEALRKKAIMHGILAFVQAIIQLIIGGGIKTNEGVTESMKRLQFELLETVDAPHFRLHLYTIYGVLKNRVNNMKNSEDNPQLEQEKEALTKILNDISNEKLFSQLRITLEHQIGNSQKSIKIKVPPFVEQLDHFLTGTYLIQTFNRYKKIIEYSLSHPQVSTNNDQSPALQKKKTHKNYPQPGSASHEGVKEPKTKELLDSQIELLQQNLNKQYQKQTASKFVKTADQKIKKKKTNNDITYENKKMHGTVIGNDGMTGLEIGGGHTTQMSYYQSIEREIVGTENGKQSLNHTPEIKGRLDINSLNDKANSGLQDEKQLQNFVKTNIPLAHSNQARNIVLGASTFVKSNTNVIDKGASIGIGRTISSDNHQQSPLVLPSLEASKKQQSKESSNSLYFMKLQPYLMTKKITTRLSAPKRVQNQNGHHNHHMALLTQAYGSNIGAGTQNQGSNTSSFPFNSVKKLQSQINHTGSQVQLNLQNSNNGPVNQTMKSQHSAAASALGNNPNSQYSLKSHKNNQNSLLQRPTNIVQTTSDTNSASKMVARDIVESLKSDQTKSSECVKDDPYSQLTVQKSSQLNNNGGGGSSLQKMGIASSDKKKQLAPLIQNQGTTPQHRGGSTLYKMMSVTESIVHAIKITVKNN